MKALTCTAFGPLDNLEILEQPIPEPGPQEVVINVKAASINYPDALMALGRYQVKPPLPFSPGMESAGIVTAVGTDVQGIRAGDRVAAFSGWGAFAEQVRAPVNKVMPLPDDLPFDQAAAFGLTYCTTLHALKNCGRLQSGETLLVLGAAGGVGTAAVEIGKALGARVIAAASGDKKLALCRQLGADETVNYTTQDLRLAAKKLTNGQGVNVVYDPVGGEYSLSALRATAWQGRLLVIGFATGEIPQIPLNMALLSERSIIGVFWGEWARRNPQAQLENWHQLTQWISTDTINPAISERLPLEQTVAAMKRLMDRQAHGKIVVLP